MAACSCDTLSPCRRVFSYLEKQEQSARDFRKFLEVAPADHRSRPDALYALALDAAMAKDMAAARQRWAGEGSWHCLTPLGSGGERQRGGGKLVTRAAGNAWPCTAWA